MADKEKYSFIVVKYPKKETGEEALSVVLGLAKEKVVKLGDAVAITKTDKGKIKLHQTKDDTAGKGFLKGGLIGIIFAVLFGPAGWVAAGAMLGTAFAIFDRGIKNKLLKTMGKEMTSQESALAVLVEDADWDVVKERMAPLNFQGVMVVSEVIGEHLAGVEKLKEDPKTTEPVPEELEIPAEAVVAAAAVEAVAEEPAAAVVVPETRPVTPIENIEGIGPVYSAKLKAAGVECVEDLLSVGASRKGREDLAEKTGITGTLVLKWVNMADLMRIHGIGAEYSELLEVAGVDTVKELRNRNPEKLHQAMADANEKRKLVRRMPSQNDVNSWVAQAKELDTVMTY